MNTVVSEPDELNQDLVSPIFRKIGEPFKYKIIENGYNGSCEWELDNTGHLYIYPKNGISGKLENSMDLAPNAVWRPYSRKIYYVTIEKGVCANKNAAFLFSGLYNCRIINAERLNVSETRVFSCMFEGCKNLKKVDLRWWNTSNAIDMSGMFYDCHNLEWIVGDLRNFDTSKVKSMNGMFFNCNSIELLNLNNFNLNNVFNMTNMFANCSKLKTLFFKNLVTNEYSSGCEIKDIFKHCSRLKEPYVRYSKSTPTPAEKTEPFKWDDLKLSMKKSYVFYLILKICGKAEKPPISLQP